MTAGAERGWGREREGTSRGRIADLIWGGDEPILETQTQATKWETFEATATTSAAICTALSMHLTFRTRQHTLYYLRRTSQIYVSIQIKVSRAQATHSELVAASQAAHGRGERFVDCREELDEVFIKHARHG